jgi:hypothetical protein
MILWISVTALLEHNLGAGPARLLTLTPLDEKALSMLTSGSLLDSDTTSLHCRT